MKANEYKFNIDRVEQAIDAYLQKYESFSLNTRSNHFWCIKKFIAFIKENGRQNKGYISFAEGLLMQWMSQTAKTVASKSAPQIFAAVYHFLQAIADTGVISTNPMTKIKTNFDKRGWEGIAWAFKSNNPQTRLILLVVEPLFKGDFGKQAQSYVALHRAAGKKYRYSERLLVEFNRFINERGVCFSKSVTPRIIREWLTTMTCNQTSRRKKLCAMKLFFEHLSNLGIVEQNPVTTQIINAVGPRQYLFKPYIYSEEQIRALLREAGKVPCSNLFKLKPQVLTIVITMLYNLGLRNGEALRLRIKDVNMEQGTLFIRNTKFYKDRIVPFGPELGKHLLDSIQA